MTQSFFSPFSSEIKISKGEKCASLLFSLFSFVRHLRIWYRRPPLIVATFNTRQQNVHIVSVYTQNVWRRASTREKKRDILKFIDEFHRLRFVTGYDNPFIRSVCLQYMNQRECQNMNSNHNIHTHFIYIILLLLLLFALKQMISIHLSHSINERAKKKKHTHSSYENNVRTSILWLCCFLHFYFICPTENY